MQFKNAFQSFSKTCFNQVIKYGSFCRAPATHYGKDMKLIARESFTEYISEHHEHVLVKETATRSSKLPLHQSMSRWHLMLILS